MDPTEDRADDTRRRSWRETVATLQPGEGRLVLLSALYLFCLLASYYALRPIRDSFGAVHRDELHWLFTGTLCATLIAQPLYGHLVAHRGRAAFIPIAYRFLIACAVVFGVLLGRLEGAALAWVERAYFVWLSVYIVMGVTVFWGFMADIMGSGRAKRLYGLIALGGSLGAAFGSVLAGWWIEGVAALTRSLGAPEALDNTVLLPLTAAVLLELAVRAARAVERTQLAPEAGLPETDASAPVGGTALAGFRSTLHSPYLLAICAYVFLFVVGSTMQYSINSEIVSGVYPDARERTAFFGRVDLLANVATFVLQIFVTGHVLRRFGLGIALAAVPLASLIGFGAIAVGPALPALATLFVTRRSFEFSFSKPARDALFTVVPREDKYKAKAVIDAVVYRGGDAVTMWAHKGLVVAGVTLAGFAWSLVPLAAASLALALWLGRAHKRREAAERAPQPLDEALFARAPAAARLREHERQ